MLQYTDKSFGELIEKFTSMINSAEGQIPDILSINLQK